MTDSTLRGIPVDIFRPANYPGCHLNALLGCRSAILELEGGHAVRSASEPGIRLVRNAIGGGYHAEPVGPPPEGHAGWLFGGHYVASSDSRFTRAVGFYGAIPLHDRSEPWEHMNRMD